MKSNFCNFYQIALCFAISIGVFVSCTKNDEDVYDVNIDFQNANIPANPGYVHNAGDGLDGIFTEGIISFPNYYNEEYGSWSGFAYSIVHDIETNDYTNYGVYVANDPPTNKFMLAYLSDPVDYSPNVSISFSQPVKDLSFDVANATYAALTMIDGGAFGAKKFTDDDWFVLTIIATNSKNEQLTPQNIKLADGTKIVEKWTRINIAGEGIVELQFSMSSTDNATWGMNTPAYFCMDNIKARIVK